MVNNIQAGIRKNSIFIFNPNVKNIFQIPAVKAFTFSISVSVVNSKMAFRINKSGTGRTANMKIKKVPIIGGSNNLFIVLFCAFTLIIIFLKKINPS